MRGGMLGIENQALPIKRKIIIELQPWFEENPNKRIIAHFWILPKSSKWSPILPEKDISCAEVPAELSSILADPLFWKAQPVSMILNVGTWTSVLSEKAIKLSNGLLCQDSLFGKIISGQLSSNTFLELDGNQCANISHAQENSFNELQKSIQKFWEFEDISMCNKNDANHELVEQIFQRSHYRDETGQFIVTIPLNPNVQKLGSSREIALKRFLMLEKRFEKNSEFKQKYVEFMREYEQLGHMREVTTAPEPGEMVYYIPHHGVFTSNKFRVVFDASCKTNEEISLNDIQLVGEKLQRDLHEQIMRFRKHAIGIIADINKMYRQVKIIPSQYNLQRIFWRENPNDKLKEYCLVVITYGLASSPHCAVRAMIEGANSMIELYPEAVKIIKENFYMDDGLFGAHSKEKALALAKDVKYVLSKSGFDLCKWKSNERTLAQEMDCQNPSSVLLSDSTFVLGLKWLLQPDEFTYEISHCEQLKKFTKRTILGRIAQLYDPNGFLAPFIAKAKMFMQKLWHEKLDWDSAVSIQFEKEWAEIWSEIKSLEQIRIPRWIKIEPTTKVQVHGFADASQSAYGAVIYIRVVDSNNKIHSNLLVSKSRVAPKKTISIPRLELAAACLLSELFTSVIRAMEFQSAEYYLWTDSTTVLQWINKNLYELKLFVANRVKRIQENTNIKNWNHVQTHENPADLVSRGLKASELAHNSLWWNGPTWIVKPQELWPKSFQIDHSQQRDEVITELKVHTLFVAQRDIKIYVKNRAEPVNLIDYSNNLDKIKRILSYVMRFVQHLKKGYEKKPKFPIKKDRISETIGHSFPLPSKIEQAKALQYLIKVEQSKFYAKELNYFKECAENKEEKIPFPERSKISALSPFVGEDELLRVGGRLSSAHLSEDTKHPVIIPNESRLSELIIWNAHSETEHGHVQQMIHYIRTNFWISNLRSDSRKIIHKCVTCARYNKKFETQLMSGLPADRIRRNRAFLISGVDYAGPIEIVERYKSRSNKRKCWIAIFVCMVTRAVHIDIVCDLTAAEFIACFERFVCKRGHCNRLYSDNGTSFVGAYKELKTAFKEWNVPSVHEHLNKRKTEWIFMKPAAPHQGGIYEAAVKSAKYHLKRVIGPKSYTYGALMTLLSKIEAILNSRPICALSDDAHDIQALTPGHFMIGEPFILPPPINVPQQTDNSIKRMRNEQQSMLENFWKRWEKEYLTSLLQRKKWLKEKDHFKIGQIVLVGDENQPPSRWLLGKITKLLPSKDGLVRSVVVQTQKSKLTRPVQKIVILPVATEEQKIAHSKAKRVNKTIRKRAKRKMIS